MDQQPSDYSVRDLVQSLQSTNSRFFELIAPALERHESAAQAVAEQPSIHPFAEEVGEAVATLSQNFFDFSETMRNIYARQRGDARRDYVPTRDDLVFRLFERWRITDGHQGNGPRQREQIIEQLEALFAPASAEPELDISKVAREVEEEVIQAKRWKQLTSDIEQVLITLVDDNDAIMYRRRAAGQLITRLIERFVSND